MLYLNGRPWSTSDITKYIVCTINMVEDTLHILGECPFYSDLRLKYFHKEILFTPKCIELLNGNFDWSTLTQFIRDLLYKRKTKLKGTDLLV